MKFMNKISEVKKLINDVEYILIGAGAGLSTSAGIEYTGKRFTNNFAEFIKSIILQICILLRFMILKQKRKNGHIGQNIYMLIIQGWKQQNFIKNYLI